MCEVSCVSTNSIAGSNLMNSPWDAWAQPETKYSIWIWRPNRMLTEFDNKFLLQHPTFLWIALLCSQNKQIPLLYTHSEHIIIFMWKPRSCTKYGCTKYGSTVLKKALLLSQIACVINMRKSIKQFTALSFVPVHANLDNVHWWYARLNYWNKSISIEPIDHCCTIKGKNRINHLDADSYGRASLLKNHW